MDFSELNHEIEKIYIYYWYLSNTILNSKLLKVFNLFCFSVVLQYWWTPAWEKGSTTVHPCCWSHPEQDWQLLYCRWQTAHPLPSHQLLRCFWWTVQITLRVQPVIRGVPGPALHICADNSLQHRCHNNRWVSKNPWVAGKTPELVNIFIWAYFHLSHINTGVVH